MNQDHARHIDAATAARQLIDDTPGTAAMAPEERERLQQTIEAIITRARAPRDLTAEQRPWARRYQTQMGRAARREDRTMSAGKETAS